MIEVKRWSEAPAGTYNPFANDERCEAVHYVVGVGHEVFNEIKMLMANDSDLIDYDIWYDETIDEWVGGTCRDV